MYIASVIYSAQFNINFFYIDCFLLVLILSIIETRSHIIGIMNIMVFTSIHKFHFDLPA